MKRVEVFEGKKITPAKKVCPYKACPHHMLHQLFNIDRDPVETDYIRQAGSCMAEIDEADMEEGVAGIRRGATQQEIADIYQVKKPHVSMVESSACKKIAHRIRQQKSRFGDFSTIYRRFVQNERQG